MFNSEIFIRLQLEMLQTILSLNSRSRKSRKRVKVERRSLQVLKWGKKSKALALEQEKQSKMLNQLAIFLISSTFQRMSLKNKHKTLSQPQKKSKKLKRKS